MESLHSACPEIEDDDVDGVLRCPYNDQHEIGAGEFLLHLSRCAQQHRKKERKNLVTQRCPYNGNHWYPAKEAKMHLSTCEDATLARRILDDSRVEKQRWLIPPKTVVEQESKCDLLFRMQAREYWLRMYAERTWPDDLSDKLSDIDTLPDVDDLHTARSLDHVHSDDSDGEDI